MDKFKVRWEAEDGYIGGSRPQSFHIDADDLWDDMDDADIEEFFYEALQDDFEMTVQPASDDLESFKDWARSVIDNRGEEE